MAMGFADFGMDMLKQLGMNTSNRIGTGASLRRQMLREQVKQTQAEAAAGIVGRVEGAKAAGIHPLVAMGSPVQGAAPVSAVGPSFNSSGYFGQQEMQQREMSMRREELQHQREVSASNDKFRKEAAANALEEQRLRNQLTQTQIDAQRKAMADSDRDFAASQAALARRGAAVTPPTLMKDQWVQVRDRFGKPIWIPNPDLYDLELPESVGAGTLAVPEAGSPWWTDFVDKMKEYERRLIRQPINVFDAWKQFNQRRK